MTGIFLVAVVLIWLVTAMFITRWVTSHFKSLVVKVVAATVTLPTLLMAPLADEFIGMKQFHGLCRQYALDNIDRAGAQNANVISVDGRVRTLPNTAVRIDVQSWAYQNVATGKVVVSYNTLTAQGGWLIRAMGMSETNAPLIFNGSCAPIEYRKFIDTFNIKILN